MSTTSPSRRLPWTVGRGKGPGTPNVFPMPESAPDKFGSAGAGVEEARYEAGEMGPVAVLKKPELLDAGVVKARVGRPGVRGGPNAVFDEARIPSARVGCPNSRLPVLMPPELSKPVLKMPEFPKPVLLVPAFPKPVFEIEPRSQSRC